MERGGLTSTAKSDSSFDGLALDSRDAMGERAAGFKSKRTGDGKKKKGSQITEIRVAAADIAVTQVLNCYWEKE